MSKPKANLPKIRLIQGDESRLDDVRQLWQRLNQHHMERSPCFKGYYEAMTFVKRKAMFQQKAARGEMLVEVAVDSETGERVGYCISSLDQERTGEVESIYVLEAYRGRGIGDALMRSALEWMQQKGAAKKTVIVAAGNEQAFGFYERYGFHIRKTMMEQV
jgi:ribosomal protein S18 acetylase RimI-like enzyme